MEKDCQDTSTSIVENTLSSIELHSTLDVQQDCTPNMCGIDPVEPQGSNGKDDITDHEKAESRTMEPLDKRERLVQEVQLNQNQLLPETPHISPFENGDLLEVKEDLVLKGSKTMPQQRTDAGEFKDIEGPEKKERNVKDDGMKSASQMSDGSASKKKEEVKPVQEDALVPPKQSMSLRKLLADWEKERQLVVRSVKKPYLKRAQVVKSKVQDILEGKEKSVKKDCINPSSAGICADKLKDGVNLEMKEKSVKGDRKVIAPPNTHREEFGESTNSGVVCGGNLATVQPCRSKSKAVLPGEDQNAAGVCSDQKSTDIFAKEGGPDFKDADVTVDLETGSDPNQPVSMTCDDPDHFTIISCRTSLDQQTTAEVKGNSVSDFAECRIQAPPVVMIDLNTMRDLQFKLLRTKGSSPTDQDAIPAKTPQASSDMKSFYEKSAAMENSEKSSLLSSTEEQNDKSTDLQDILPSKNCSSPKNGITVFEDGIASLSRTDCKTKQTEKELEKTCSSPAHQFTVMETTCETAVQSQELESEGNVADIRSQKDTQICDAIRLLETHSVPSKGPEICDLPSILEATEKVALAKVLWGEAEDQCPTPTVDEQPCNVTNSATHLIGEETGKKIIPVCPLKSTTLIDNNMPLRERHNSVDIKDPNPHHQTKPDLELKTQGVVQSTDKNKSVTMDEDLQIFPGIIGNRKIDKVGHEIPDQMCPSVDVCSHSQRPVMAVKPSKGDNTQGTCVSQGSIHQSSEKSNCSEGKPLVHVLTIAASNPLNTNVKQDLQDSSTGTAQCSRLSSADDSMCASGTKFQQVLEKDLSKSTEILSSHLKQSSESGEDTPQKSQQGRENIELEPKSSLVASSSSGDDGVHGIVDDDPVVGPQNSLACTIFNTNNNQSESLLEKLSKRCVQNDPTEASMEQECLIFSEQMKQLLKRAKSGPIHQLETSDKIKMSCPSPVNVRFSDLEEVETETVHFDEPSFLLPKIKVDLSDRKTVADDAGRERESDGTVVHASVSGVTAECARLYTSMMNDVCGVSTDPLWPNHFRVDKVLPRAQPSNHFDYCDQMKREVDDTFCRSMNSVVRKFCKTKYKFFILATSNDVFFEKAKVRYILKKPILHIPLNLNAFQCVTSVHVELR